MTGKHTYILGLNTYDHDVSHGFRGDPSSVRARWETAASWPIRATPR
jgi:hypothetical protein